MEEPGITLDGFDELLAVLDAIVAEEDGAKSINGVLRKSTRRAVKEIVLPDVKDAIPVDSGFLEDSLKVRAMKGKRGRIGHTVGFPDPLFRGDTFYGGFLEFGWKDTKRGYGVPGDKFLRRSLYDNEARVEAAVRDDLSNWIRERNGESLG